MAESVIAREPAPIGHLRFITALATRWVDYQKRKSLADARSRRWWTACALGVISLMQLVVSCASVERLPAAPSDITEQATALGIPNERFWHTQGPAFVKEAG